MRRAALLLATLIAAACASTQPDIATLTSNSDQAIWEAGQKAAARRDWESARQHYRRIIEGFPQSEFAVPARLALADSHVREGGRQGDILAIGVFREFLTLYPSHPKSDFAQFQIGEAYFRQKNGPDRDQTDTHHALEEYQRLLDIYPSSQHAEQARARITECRQSLARAEFLAGYFYQRTREAWRSAIPRYEALLKQYPDYAQTDEVLFRLAECLQAAGRSPESLPHLGRLIEEYPRSLFAAQARQMISAAASAPPVATPPAGAGSPPPAPAASPTPAPAAPPASPAPAPFQVASPSPGA